MCEPARKLIRLTSLTEFTMSKGKAYNRASLYRPYIFVWMKSTPRPKPGCGKIEHLGWLVFSQCFFFFFCGFVLFYLSALRASDWCAKAAAYPPGFCLEPGPTNRKKLSPRDTLPLQTIHILNAVLSLKGTELKKVR